MKTISIFWTLLLGVPVCSSQVLHDILSAPYASDLTAGPNGNTICWVSYEAGIRSVFSASAPDFEPIKRYGSQEDDGQILRNFQFDPHAENLYFVRGSATNRRGEVANPSSTAAYPQTQLLRVNLTAKILDTLGSFSNYVVNPDGTDLLIVAGKKLQRLDLTSKELTSMIEMRGTFSDVSFSPDGSSICFVSNRGDHSFIGHYTLGEKQVQWLSPSVYRDQFPVWSANGKQVAFIRSPGVRRHELFNLTGGHRFSIMIHDLEEGQVREVWDSPKDDGGFAQYYPSHPLRWAANGKILFYSEHEGWMKIYSLDPGLGTAVSIQSGACEIEHSDLSTDGRKLVFSSNCAGDIDRRNLFSYDMDSDQLRQLTSGDDIETDPQILAGGNIAYRHATYQEPTAIYLYRNETTTAIHPSQWPPSMSSFDFVKPRQVIFKAADGTDVHAQLFVREESGDKPGLLFMHGGPIRQMLLGFHYSSYYANAYMLNQFLAHQGYAVMSVNYRAGIGYGRNFRRADKQGPRGASEYQDIVAAGKYLQGLPYVDDDRIGLWGGSYGGYLTAMGLANDSELFKAGVDFHGVHDWSWRATDFSEGGAWGITDDLMDEAYNSSPVANLDDWKSPVLLIHGDDDRNVMFGQTIDLAERLKERKVPTEILVFPDEVHGFYRYESWLRSFQVTVDFFNRFLLQP